MQRARERARIRLAALALAAGVVAFATVRSPGAQQPVQDSALLADYAAKVKPLFAKHCYACHSGGTASAGFNLAGISALEQVRQEPARWRRLREYVATGHMPPAGSPAPSQADRKTITDWVDAVLGGRRKPGDPGRVTLRRLNRSQYNNTVRDLLYLKATPADAFPSDDVGYGFDDIGDVLTVSPLLMEKYLAAAERLAEQAIVVPGNKTTRFEASEFGQVDGTALTPDGDRNFYTNAFVAAPYVFPSAGDYVVRVRAYGQQAGPDPCKMAVRLDGKPLQTVDVATVASAPGTYQVPLTTTAGKHRLEVGFVNDYYNPGAADASQRDRNLILMFFEVEGPIGQEQALPDSHTRIITVYPGQLDDVSAARKVIGDFARRAYRRPVTQEELDRLVAIYRLVRSKGDPYERGIQVAVTAVLASPSFVFLTETDAKPTSDGQEALGDWAIASRLSYFLWSSMPDDQLFDLAAKGQLQNPRVLEAQVDRMLKDPRARALADDFAGQWLNLRLLETMTPDPATFPDWSDQLRADMVAETKAFFNHVVDTDSSIVDFLDGRYSFLNDRLAAHYGVPGVVGGQLRLVQFKDALRGGLVTQGSMLTVTSNPNRTSPVKRGKWILNNILGGTPPPPPPNVGVLPEDVKAMDVASLRDRMERHRRDPNCAACHAQMDPLGFALENFDGTGRWRTTDGKWQIDDSGQLPDGTKFQGAEGLRKLLVARKRDFAKVLSSKLLTYALGRGLEPADDPTVQRIADRVVKNGYRISDVIKGVVASDAFRKRVVEQ